MNRNLPSAFRTLVGAFAGPAVLAMAFLATVPVFAYEEKKPESPAATPARQYTFSWQFTDGGAMAPRGGTTKGPEVTLATEPSEAWKRLREPGLSALERDRRAILAMAGGYRVSFDFIEVAGFDGPYEPKKPYQSWGTEKVYVIEDRGDFISLQHLLVTTVVGDDGKAEGPFVTKHWRQDWQYEPESEFVYRGNNTWQPVAVPESDRKGAWRQSVYQVDDSPRYSGVGRWEHFGNYSTWVGGEGWRPLPRREYSVRDDYQVLLGTNRHTITPTGWVHEQQNNKVALDASGAPVADRPVVGREFGFNRYELIRDYDFSAGDRYLAATQPLWEAVRAEWTSLLSGTEPVHLKGAPDRDKMFMPLFEMAEALEKAPAPDAAARAKLQADARAKVRAYVAPAAAVAVNR
jgi:uncharacterized protein DUF6607